MKNQTGNILLFILIAILLIGLLTLSLTRSSNQTNDTGDFEQNVIIANEILNYAKSVEIAVQNLLARGCSENDINFGGASPKPECEVFGQSGMGIDKYNSEQDGKWLINGTLAWPLNTIFTATTRVIGVGNSDLASDGHDLIMFIPNLQLGYCMAINSILGIENPSNYPPRDNNGSAIEGPAFSGTFGGTNNQIETTGNELTGQRAGCFVTDNQASASDALDGEDYFYFYQTLIAK